MQDAVFVVATNSKDGGLPSAAKICDHRIYFTEEEAKRWAHILNEQEKGDYYGVYPALIEIRSPSKEWGFPDLM
jgi:hypothetical protein